MADEEARPSISAAHFRSGCDVGVTGTVRKGVTPCICIRQYGAHARQTERTLCRAFPRLKLVAESPPFRSLTPEEGEAAVRRIVSSGAGVLFVGLGCPKQELWMHSHRGRIPAVMLGVGAAFDFHAGTVSRAPLWMQRNGLEWLHRLLSEPRRLWKRYLITNTLFVIGAARQLLKKDA